jgi:hypothetical protein
MKRICLVIPYFGKLPTMFPLWLNSCRHNDTVNWSIFTDDRSGYNYPPNVRVCYTTFEQMKSRIQALYDFDISLGSPYKLCEYKPAYGEIFREELEGFDFWGYSDVDLIFGNFRKFITEEILSAHDKVLTRGHLTLFRNDAEINAIYKREIHGRERYKDVFTNSEICSFDEWGGTKNNINSICEACNVSMYNEILFSDICQGKYAFYPYQLMKNEPQKSSSIYLWERGTLSRFWVDKPTRTLGRDEALYVHFQKRKMVVGDGCDTAERFVARPNRFERFDGEIDADFVLKAGRDKLIYGDYVKIRFNNLKKKIRRLVRKKK